MAAAVLARPDDAPAGYRDESGTHGFHSAEATTREGERSSVNDDERAARYAAADERVQLFRSLLARAAQRGRMAVFFRYAAALAGAMNDRAAAVEEALSPVGDTAVLDSAT